MATRSLIGIQNTDGSIAFAYCHWDGYPTGVGKNLIGLGRREARALINKGDMSSLGEHYINRGESWDIVKPKEITTLKLFIDQRRRYGCDYAYLISKTGTWKVAGYDEVFKSLRRVLKENV